jgi:hypothetical protein
MDQLCRGLILALLLSVSSSMAMGGTLSAGAKQSAEFIFQKFGKRVPTQTVDELAAAVSGVAAKYGDDALPFLKATGHAGFDVLDQAGAKAPEIIKLYVKRGDEAVWVISKPGKLAIFLKHGDGAAEALIKHPGIADKLIARHGDEAITAISRLSQQNAQRLGMLADDGLLSATQRSPELLGVISRYGDTAMNFVWNNKGALTVGTFLAGFLADPEAYFSGVKSLVEPVAKSVVEPIVKSVNWTLLLSAIFFIAFLPIIVRSIRKGRSEWRSRHDERP